MQQHTPVAATATRSLARTPWFPLVLIVSLFFLWGVANNLNDVLVAQFKKAFTLSDFQAGLVQSAFYLGYFLLAIPAGIFMRRFGYKAAVVFGLSLYGAGALLFWPAAATATYETFLVGLFVIAAGLAFLETSANPWVTLLGPRESAASRLNLAQAFNPLGSITGVLIGQHFIFTGVERTPAELAAMDEVARATYMRNEAAAVQMPYLVIGLGVIAWAVIIVVTRFPRATAGSDGSDAAERGVLSRLLRDGRFMSAVLAQFFYVGAQVAVFSYMIRYAQATMPGTADKVAANFITAGLLCFMAGRFAGAAIMKYLRPARVLSTFALVNVILAGVAAFVPGRVGIYALVASSFFMSIMYPTIFAESVAGLGPRTKSAAALLVMAIIGGAVLTAAMGYVSDTSGSILWAMLVPATCFLVVMAFALRARTLRM